MAVLVPESEYLAFCKWCSNKKGELLRLPSHDSFSQAYNREAYWAPSFRETVINQWETVYDSVEHKLNKERKIWPNYQFEVAIHDCEVIEWEEVPVASYLPAYIHINWEGEYDASKKNPVFHTMPAPAIMQTLGLHQNDLDGVFYSPENDIIAFEQGDTDVYNRLWIRKDKLKDFALQKDFHICWLCYAEKHFYYGNGSGYQEWTDWCGFFTEKKGNLVGEMVLVKESS